MPQLPICSRTSTASPPATTGTWNNVPADARTGFGLYTSTEPPQQTTPSAPAASALRRTVPALPGSRTSTQTTRNEDSRRLSSGTSTYGTIAMTGCGVTVSATRSSTPGARVWMRAPVASASAGTSPGASGARYTPSTGTPAARASESSLAPSRRSEEHTSELQSQSNLVCRLLLEKKKKKTRMEREDVISTSYR